METVSTGICRVTCNINFRGIKYRKPEFEIIKKTGAKPAYMKYDSL